MKYIVIAATYLGERGAADAVEELPFVFPAALEHARTSRDLERGIQYSAVCSRRALKSTAVVGAGFVSIFGGVITCGGRSDSLGIESRGERDAALLVKDL